MLKFYQALTVTSLLLLFFSCSRSNNSNPSVIAQSNSSASVSSESEYSSPNQQTTFVSYDPAKKRFLVSPEIAVMQAKVSAKGKSFAEAAQLIEVNSDKVIKNLAAVQGCSATITNYQYPTEEFGKRVLDDTPVYFSSLEIDILISFDGLNSTSDRIKRLNNCVQALPELKLDTTEKNISIGLSLSEAIPTIKNLDNYRQQLLEAKFSSLQEVTNLAAAPSQFQANETKCTSKGIVQIANRSLSNIELDIDFNCQQFNKSS
jgi:hypothetical protein